MGTWNTSVLDYPIDPKNDLERIIDGLRIGVAIAIDALAGQEVPDKGEVIALLAALVNDPESAIQLSRAHE